MDAYEATRIVFSRIQSLDPENASKIMGLLLIQDHGEKEMIRLAFGPESLFHSVILKARKELGLSSNSPSTSPSTPSSPSPLPFLSRQNSASWLSGGGGVVRGINLPSPLSIPNPSASPNWATFFDFQEDLTSPTFVTSTTNSVTIPVSSVMNSSASPFYGSGGGGGGGGNDLIDEFQLQDQLSFLNDGSPILGPKSPDLYYTQPELASSPGANGAGDTLLFPSYSGAAGWGGLPHRRSCSVSDICLGSDDPSSGFGWKPCLYFARGYCKNGNSCRFLHDNLVDPDGGGCGGGGVAVGSPSKLDMMEQCHELFRSKSAHQQRFAAASQLMGSSSLPYSPTSSNKCMNFLLQQQQSDTQRAAAAAMIMGEDMHKFGRTRLERNDFGGVGMMNSSSRQIYLTFPADSTFREEDVSNYFSNYGPVQDVRIPYQQKRMFGFVTFVYPETVKMILAKGNPHFVCDARVLVKPYKEKGKVPDKYRKQQMERGEFSACGSPTGLDSKDPYEFQLGARMYYNTQQMLWKRKLEEQADLQQAIELQGRRLMGLQLLDVKRNHHRTLSTGGAIPSPTHSPNFFSQTLLLPSDRNSPEIVEENGSSPDQHIANATEKEKDSSSSGNDGSDNGKESSHHEESDLHESLEHNLPDSPFASPKAPGEFMTSFSASDVEDNAAFPVISSANNNLISSTLLPATSTLDMANSFKSCYFQVPRFSSGQGAIEM